MADHSNIEWTDARTPIVDRGGRRVRFYCRADSTRPGQQERRLKAAEGLKWCRGCRDWLYAPTVSAGACRSCASAEERARYAANTGLREYRKSQRDLRRRGALRMKPENAELISDLFDGECAYCKAKATSWDHFTPVTHGGETIAGNMLPACGTCNSRKKNTDPRKWLWERAPAVKFFTVEYLTLAEAL